MAAESSRKYIMGRRGTGIGDLSLASPFTDGMGIDEVERTGIFKFNATHHCGIATTTEIGLNSARFPIRVLFDADLITNPRIDTVVGYWAVVDSAGAPVPFQRKPFESDLPIRNLFKIMTDFDDRMWTCYDAVKGRNPAETFDETMAQQTNDMYAILQVVNPTNAQIAQFITLFATVSANCIRTARFMYVKIADNAYIKSRPHGVTPHGVGDHSVLQRLTAEGMATILLNFTRLKQRNPAVSDGVNLMGAYTINSMFRLGIYEAHEKREYHTVVIAPVANASKKYTISHVFSPDGAEPLEGLTVGTEVDINPVKLKKEMVELGNMFAVTAGIMHYMYNHTTGSSIMMGTLLTAMSIYNFVNDTMPNEMLSKITDVMYEAMHPVNKRGIASVAFKKSGVTSWGRSSCAYRMEKVVMDAFLSIRCNPYPAGAHKAFICASALQRVLKAGLGNFLPWADNMNGVIQTCSDVIKNGARAHIGSVYYTGDPPKVQPASLDKYLPDLAFYIHTFHRGDSLCFSPHMSLEMSRGADPTWQGLCKKLKGEDVSGTDAETVRKYLKTAGTVFSTFKPADETTWARAIQDAHDQVRTLDEVFN